MTDNNKAQRLAREFISLDPTGQAEFENYRFHPDQLPAEPADTWVPLTMWDAYQPQEPARYIVNGLLEVGTLNILYGAPGSLKSFIMQDLAVCVAMGKPWLLPAPWGEGGQAIPTMQSPVLWIDFDMGRRRTLERFGALGRHYGAPDDLPIKIFTMPRPRLNAANLDHIDVLIERAIGAGLVVIDNLRTISGGIDENSSQMSDVMEGLRELTERTDSAVVPIHHERKGNGLSGRAGEALRGHSSIEAALDLALKVEREPYSDIITIKSTKTRGLEVLPFNGAFTFEKNPDDSLNTAAFFSVESEDTQSNYAIEREIKAALQLEPMNQSKLWEAVHEELPDVGKNRIIDQIKRLEASDKLTVTTGSRNAKIYSLPVYRSLPELTGKLD